MGEIWSKIILTMLPPRVVTIIGGGGKTSLMYYLLTLLQDKGYATIATTTTKLSSQHRSGNCFVKVQSVEAGYQAIQQVGERQGHVTLVYSEDNNNPEKMMGIPSEWINEFATRCSDTIFIVEGDGAAGKPLKGHLAHEPVIPSTSSIVIVMIGIDSIGTRLTAQYVHRPERICQLTGASPDSFVTTDMISQLLFHPQGYLQYCPQYGLIIPVINKVETANQHQQAEQLVSKILANKHPQVYGVMVGSIIKEEWQWLQG